MKQIKWYDQVLNYIGDFVANIKSAYILGAVLIFSGLYASSGSVEEYPVGNGVIGTILFVSLVIGGIKLHQYANKK